MIQLLQSIWSWFSTNWQGITAAAALILTFWEIRTSRKHNRLSVQPEIVTHVHASEDDMSFSICISNAGLGPARIRSFKFILNGIALPCANPHQFIDALRTSVLDMEHKVDVNLVRENFALAEGANCNVLTIQFRNVAAVRVPAILAALRRIDVYLEYESIYGDKFQIDQSALGGG